MKLGDVTFEVADYVPETIDVTLKSAQEIYSNTKVAVSVNSEFLYGAPAEYLPVESGLTLFKSRRPFAKFKKYLFGTSKEFEQFREKLPETHTDGEGNALLTLPADLITDSSVRHQPIKIRLRVGVVEPNGRLAQRTLDMLALHFPSWVGVQSENDYPVYDVDKPIGFNLINVDRSQDPVPNNELSYKVFEEKWDYHWYRTGGEWKYRVDVFDRAVIESGKVTTNELGRSHVSLQNRDWGRYRLEVTDEASSQVTDLRYRVGWWSAEGNQAAIPDNVKIAPDRGEINPGDSVTINIQAPYAGKLHLIVATDSILEERFVELDDKQVQVTLDSKPSWGTGVYFLATVYRPGENNV